MELFLIDGIGPFFRGYNKRRINWSKIPFHRFSEDREKFREQFVQIAKDMDIFAAKVKNVGYNAVSLDDVAHLAQDEWHDQHINMRIVTFVEQYQVLFSILQAHGLEIYLTMDILTYSPKLRSMIAGSKKKGFQFIQRQINKVFSLFPEVKGIIFRIGECDGTDVKGDFVSELFLKTPRDVNHMLKILLPLFEQHQRFLILRNWTVGAYRIGDFIWHRGTTEQVLRGIRSPNFILSMKYGETDFFRYLPLNKNFLRFNVKKIVELQAKREYEGCGEFPSFIGWDYQDYAHQLESAKNLVGISVWCQTGGWVPFRRLTYLDESAIWNELNSFVTLKVFKQRWTVEQAISSFCTEIGCDDPDAFCEILHLSDQVIKQLLYTEEIAKNKQFFRRVRIPPLVNVYWNNIFINDSVRKLLLYLVQSPEHSLEQGYGALEKIARMKQIAESLGLQTEDFTYMEDTFSILALARSYYLQPNNIAKVRKKIRKAKRIYKNKYPKGDRPRYRIRTNYEPFPVSIVHLSLLLKLFLRTKRGYRLVDYLFTLHLLGVIYRLVVRLNPKTVPKFARKQAMGIESIFR